MVATGQSNLTANDRLYSGIMAGFGKFHGPAEIVVVGDGEGLIAKAGGLPHHLSNGGSPFLEAVVGVQVKLGVHPATQFKPSPRIAAKSLALAIP